MMSHVYTILQALQLTVIMTDITVSRVNRSRSTRKENYIGQDQQGNIIIQVKVNKKRKLYGSRPTRKYNYIGQDQQENL